MKILDLIYDGDDLILQSEDGIGKVKSITKKDIQKYKGLEINSLEDFEKIKDGELKNLIQLAFFDSVESPWKFINQDNKQLPRPLSVVYTKEKGFREFSLLSLSAPCGAADGSLFLS